MTNTSKIMFLLIMVMGTLLTLSSESWLGMWMGMELNMIAFIPIMFKPKNNSISESCMIYFLIQSMASILMLIIILSNPLITSLSSKIMNYTYTMLTFSMLIKLGVPPFHFWFPEILEKMEWMKCFMLTTWQKIAPMCVLSFTLENSMFSTMIIILSSIVGAIGGLNQTSLRKIMGYSSINHMSWMIACMKFNNDLWMKYLIIYSLITSIMMYLFNFYSAFHINQFNTMNMNFPEKMLINISFLSLGGLPPFLGFISKWMVIQSMIVSNSYYIMIIMILSVLITLFYYIRLISSNLLINNDTLKWYSSHNMNYYMIMIFMFINLSLPTIPILML